MDTAVLSATPALSGSLTGGAFDLAASWLTLRGRVSAQSLVRQAAMREPFYADFTIEARPDTLPMPGVITPKVLRLSPISVRPSSGDAPDGRPVC
jgi:hypothetical protein